MLTAAHCVINPLTGAPFPLRDIHFLAGVRGPDTKDHSTAKCLHFVTNYKIALPERFLPTPRISKAPLGAWARDIVTIVLQQELAVDPVPLAESVVPRARLELVHAAYAADRRFRLSAHFNCHLLRFDVGSLWFNDCDTHPASSGGPLLTRIDGVLKLAAIMLGTLKGNSNLALPLSQWKELTGDRACP